MQLCLEISKNRRYELEDPLVYKNMRSKIKDIQLAESLTPSIAKEDSIVTYGDLPF